MVTKKGQITKSCEVIENLYELGMSIEQMAQIVGYPLESVLEYVERLQVAEGTKSVEDIMRG